MELNSEQYERIARRLDGERTELSPAEQAAAMEIVADEATLAVALGEPVVPARAMARASRRLQASLAARPAVTQRHAATARPGVRGRFIAVVAAGAAVAAAILMVWAFRAREPQAPTPSDVPVDYLVRVPGGEAIQSLAREVDRFEADLAVSRAPAVVDWQIDSVQHEIDTFWQDEAPWEVPES